MLIRTAKTRLPATEREFIAKTTLLPRPGVRNEDVRDYFVAMTRVFRCGDLEVKGLTHGSLKTSLDFVLGMEAGGL